MSWETVTDLDIPGPGRPTPEEAVAPYAEGGDELTAEPSGDRTATVHVLDEDGEVVQVFQVSRHRDGWWPDSITECTL